MFCPLCKTEYRSGFTQCSDCHAKLVAAGSEAKNVQVITLWKGLDKSKFEDLLTALQYADIPHRFGEHLKYSPQNQSDYEYEIRLVESDAERGRDILRQLEEAERAQNLDLD